MTRVAHLCADPGVPAFGTKGASVHVQEIVRAFRNRGDDVALYCARAGAEVPADLGDLPVTVRALGDHDTSSTATREKAQARISRRLVESALADGAELIYERYSLFSTAIDVARRAGVPGVLEVNAPLIEEQQRHRELHDVAGAEAALVAQATAADVVVCVSAPVAAWVGRRVPGARTVIVPNGVNTDRIRPLAAHGAGDDVVVFVGTLKPWHGVQHLIRAAALARRPWRLRLIGDGPERAAIETLAAELAVEIDLRGAVPPGQIPELLSGAVCGVAPYGADDNAGQSNGQQQYFSPLKVFEYAAAGLPVVASRVGQLEQIVTHGETGLLVEPGNPAALAAAIDLLVADSAQARTWGRAGRERMRAAHSWDRVLSDTLAARPEASAAPAPRGHGVRA